MHAIGIEGREADLRRLLRTGVETTSRPTCLMTNSPPLCVEGSASTIVANMPGAFSVAVVDKEAADIVDKKLVEVGRNRLAHTEPEGYVGDDPARDFSQWRPPIRTLAKSTCQVLRTSRSITVPRPAPPRP